jgi:carbonic anhydrase/acetyltransferase-like protein (isoleucine patch superfamily)
MKKTFDHGIPPNPYNPHSWILGIPTIGEDVWIGPFTLIDAKHAKVSIGKGCNISTGAQIISHSTVHRCVSERKYTTIDSRDVTIGDYCFIGSNAVILMGTTIGHHSVIAAGCVIPENSTIPPYSVVTGVPGKITGNTKKYL